MSPTRSAIDTALDVARIVLDNGGSTFRADQSFQSVLKGLRQTGVEAVWQLNAVTIYAQRDGGTESMLRPVHAGGINLSRVAAATILAQKVESGEVPAASIQDEIRRINTLASPYSRWLLIVMAMLAAASFSRLLGGDWGSSGIVLVAAGAGQFLRQWLQSRQLATSAATLLCAVFSAFIASIGLSAGLSQTVAATAVGSVVYMVPGLALVNGFVDLVSYRDRSVGLARILNVAFTFLILTVGIALGDALALGS